MTPKTKGNLLATVAAILFFCLCIILPIVGRSARTTPHYWANFTAFLLVLLPALACAYFARSIKIRNHRDGQEDYPWGSTILLGVLVILLLSLLTFRLDK